MAHLLVRLVMLAAIAVPLHAEQNVSPGINSQYQDPSVAQWRGVFEREGREVWDRREDIVLQLRLQPGQYVADVGAGTGFFSAMIARGVGPAGVVYAIDIAANFVDASVQRARDLGLHNVRGVLNDQHGIGLPAASVDLVFTSDTYHHFEYPQSMLRSMHAALRPGGELVVIDFKRVPGLSNAWVLGHVRGGEDHVVAEVEAAGFTLSERQDFMDSQYFLRFRRD